MIVKLLLGLTLSPLLCMHLLAQTPRVSFNSGKILVGDLADWLSAQTKMGISGEILAEQLYVSVNATDELPENILKIALAGLSQRVVKDGNNISIITTGRLWRQVKGYVTDTEGYPFEAVTVKVANGWYSAMTRAGGRYAIRVPVNTDSLVFSHINAKTQVVRIDAQNEISIVLEKKTQGLEDVTVNFKLHAMVPKGTLLGSNLKLQSPFKQRPISTELPLYLDGKGILFQNGQFLVRGASTIHSDQRPLIVVDGFPYEGDLQSINQIDIENIITLRDAVSASIWGARASNGVIVVQTRTGRFNSPLQVNVTINTLIGQQPDLYSNRQFLDSKSFIGFEQWLFDRGYFDHILAKQSGFPAISLVTGILDKRRRLQVTGAQAAAQLDSLGQIDVRKDLNKYYYQPSLRQQYGISLERGDAFGRSYVSVGYDRQSTWLQHNSTKRFTVSLNHLQNLPGWKAELSGSISLALHDAVTPNTGEPAGLYPYQRLADEKGNYLTITQDYQDRYTDTAGGGSLLDWKKRPLQDLDNADNRQQLLESAITLRLRKFLSSKFTAMLAGQWQTGKLGRTENHHPESYFTRNLVNLYTQIDGNQLKRHVPLGIIRDHGHSKYNAYNLGLQLQFLDSISRKRHWLAVSAGIDLNKRSESSEVSRIYGYGQHLPAVNTHDDFPLYLPDQYARIPDIAESKEYRTNFLSGHATASFLYFKRFSFSATVRKDASNLFGKGTNKKGDELFSVGAGWHISNQGFYKKLKKMIPYLNLRITHGTTGNVNRAVTSQTTAISLGLNPNGMPASYIINPPNLALRWEKTRITNIALEVGTPGDKLHLVAEYYYKKSFDLFATSPVDYTAGVPEFFGNAADMVGRGIDINLEWRYGNKAIGGSSTLFVSHATDRITRYQTPVGIVANYLQQGQVSPLAGRSLFALNSLPTAGLDPGTGALLALVEGQPSTKYGDVFSSTEVDQYLLNSGSKVPTWFGSFLNTVTWKRFTLSATIGFKLAYVFRRSSISFSKLASQRIGHMDFANRWQKPGDENSTWVPAAIYPLSEAMDNYYAVSRPLATKGDHIRLQHCQILWNVPDAKGRKGKFQYIHLYLYVDNPGMLWRANKLGIDPDYPGGMAPGYSIGGGVRFGLQPQKNSKK